MTKYIYIVLEGRQNQSFRNFEVNVAFEKEETMRKRMNADGFVQGVGKTNNWFNDATNKQRLVKQVVFVTR